MQHNWKLQLLAFELGGSSDDNLESSERVLRYWRGSSPDSGRGCDVIFPRNYRRHAAPSSIRRYEQSGFAVASSDRRRLDHSARETVGSGERRVADGVVGHNRELRNHAPEGERQNGEATSWTEVNVPWEIDVYGAKYDGSGKAVEDTNGLSVCTNVVSNACKTDASAGAMGTSVYVLPLGGNAGFYAAPPGFPDGYGQNGVRYRYSGTCSGPGATPLPICEHLFKISVTFHNDAASPHVYKCPDGECRVDIDQAP